MKTLLLKGLVIGSLILFVPVFAVLAVLAVVSLLLSPPGYRAATLADPRLQPLLNGELDFPTEPRPAGEVPDVR